MTQSIVFRISWLALGCVGVCLVPSGSTSATVGPDVNVTIGPVVRDTNSSGYVLKSTMTVGNSGQGTASNVPLKLTVGDGFSVLCSSTGMLSVPQGASIAALNFSLTYSVPPFRVGPTVTLAVKGEAPLATDSNPTNNTQIKFLQGS